MRLNRLPKIPLIQRTKARVLARLSQVSSAGRYLKVYPDDVYIVSYPRSGNTWMRFLLGELVFQTDIDFGNMEQYVPDIHRCTHDELESVPRPRFLKSHEPYDSRYPMVVYLIRDPRDVAISYHKWLLKFNKSTLPLDEFLLNFAENETRYQGWGNHVSGWYENRHRVRHGILIIRYEDMLEDAFHSMSRVVDFLGLGSFQDSIAEAVAGNDFCKMQGKESAALNGDLFGGTKDNIRFVRKGHAGQWREQFSRQLCVVFADAFGELATEFGYDLSDL